MIPVIGGKGTKREDLYMIDKVGAGLSRQGHILLTLRKNSKLDVFKRRLTWMQNNKKELFEECKESYKMYEGYQKLIDNLDNTYNDVYIKIEEDFPEEKIEELLKIFEEVSLDYNLHIQWDIKNEYLNKNQLSTFEKFQKVAQEKGWANITIANPELRRTEDYTLNIEKEYDESWKLETLIKANKSIKKVVEKIRKANLTPFEASIYIHLFVSRIAKYNVTPSDGMFIRQASFVGAFQDVPEIVCAGYSSLAMTIIKELNMEGLSAEEFFSSWNRHDSDKIEAILKEKGKKYKYLDINKIDFDIPYTQGLHSQVVLNIIDKEYNLDEFFLSDYTHDNRESNEFPSYANSMLSLGALYSYRNAVINQAVETDRGRGKDEETNTYKNHLLVQNDINIVENYKTKTLRQKIMEKGIFCTYKKIFPQATLVELRTVIENIVYNAYNSQYKKFKDDDIIIFKSPTPIMPRYEMESLFNKLQEEINKNASIYQLEDE